MVMNIIIIIRSVKTCFTNLQMNLGYLDLVGLFSPPVVLPIVRHPIAGYINLLFYDQNQQTCNRCFDLESEAFFGAVIRVE